MLSLIKKIFGHATARVEAPPSRTSLPAEHNAPRQSVEVAHLRLATILGRLPAELKPLVLKQPEASVTVALPIATIVKQLPSGSVKVSLATLHRQAPPGILGPLPLGDKRMVEVPLAEVFRHINPALFKRRSDQRVPAALDSGFNLFGDAQNPYQISPTAPGDEPEPVEPAPEPPRPPKVEPPAPAGAGYVPEFKLARDPEPVPSAPRVIAPPPDFFEPKLRKLPVATPNIVALPAAPPTAPGVDRPSITIPVGPLCGGWPEPIRDELAVLNGSALVALPTEAVTAGLARGKVTFTWGQIRAWIEPALGESTGADEATELTLPLKVVAPVFLAATRKAKVEQRPAEIDAEIPALFTDGRVETVVSEVVLEAPAAPETAEAPIVAEAAEAPVLLSPEAAPVEPPAAPAPAKPPQTIGELFGQPGKAEWTPAEIVAHLARLPSVSGAVVALQEGLLVAHSMPDDMKSEVIAAFLPQLFARLNQYAGEMKLGDVDDLLFTTHGAHCQIYRLGYVYFAVLGKPGEPLPWTELRLVADELARQTQKS